MTKRKNLDKVKLYLAICSLLFAVFNCIYSYGFMLVEHYRLLNPPKIWFGSYYNLYFDVLLRYVIILGCYFLYTLFLVWKEQTIKNQLLGLLILLIMQYQIGVYSFVIGKVELPGSSLIWIKEIFPLIFLYIIDILQFLSWLIGIILIVLQSISLVRTVRFQKK